MDKGESEFSLGGVADRERKCVGEMPTDEVGKRNRGNTRQPINMDRAVFPRFPPYVGYCIASSIVGNFLFLSHVGDQMT